MCGRHAKVKSVRLWAVVNADKIIRFTKVQAIARGWLVRKFLLLCGPGVLHRSDLSNDEDLVTCEEKEKQYPFDFFSFTENGKTWWFDFGTIWGWSYRSVEPTNPYTKVPLSMSTRIRLKEVWTYRRTHALPIPDETLDYVERLTGRWNVLCQIFSDNGFADVHPRTFMRINKSSLMVMFRLLACDLKIALRENNPNRERLVAFCSQMERRGYNSTTTQYTLQSAYILMIILLKQKESYEIVFMVLSALYRC